MSSTVREKSVIWIQGSGCSGCSVSVLNSVRPEIHSVLLDQIVPGQHVNLKFQATVMAGQGEAVIGILDRAADSNGGFILVVEGAIALREHCASLGEKDGKEVSFARRVASLSAKADAVVALGTCAAFGGMFASEPNVTQCVGVGEFLKQKGIERPLLNVPGCPPHPDWFLGTVAHVIIAGIPDVDELLRPKLFYGQLIHDNCQRRAHFDAGRFAKTPSEPYCLYHVGCRGPLTHADCPTRLWNGGVNWCVGNNHPCIGCCEPEFPDGTSPFFKNTLSEHAPALRRDKSGRLKPFNTVTAFQR
jgi:hydrogenase small subunit